MNIWFLMMPECILAGTACLILLMSICGFRLEKTAFCITLIALVLAASVVYCVEVIPFLIVLQELIVLCVFLICIYARLYHTWNHIPPYEFYALVLFSATGAALLSSADHAVVLFLSLELSVLPVYIMVALGHRNQESTEAGIKYFIAGSISSALLLYGFSFLFHHTLSLQILAHDFSVHGVHTEQLLGLALVLTSITFKLGLFPFYFWVPDVYEGAPTSIGSVVASVSKIAGFCVLLAFIKVFPETHWHTPFLCAALVSIFFGNYAAMTQTRIKRLLGYSSIAHTGIFLLCLTTGTVLGKAASLFYMTVYVFATVAAFGVFLILNRLGWEVKSIYDLKGLARLHPILAGSLTIVMLSMAGMPPLLGFDAKWFVLQVLLNARDMVSVSVLLLSTLMGAYYYLRIIKLMYFYPPVTPNRVCEKNRIFEKMALMIQCGILIACGCLPEWWIQWCISCF